MSKLRRRSPYVACALFAVARATAAPAPSDDPLPEPLTLHEAVDYALLHRPELEASQSRADAFAQRPRIVASLEDPMVTSSIDHYPFDMMEEEENGRRYDWSIAVEQRFPLSGVLGQRRQSAVAQADVARADTGRARLDVAYETETAYLMLHEQRRMAEVLAAQRRLADDMVASASARYAAGNGLEADVLRAEVEVARVAAARRVLRADVRAAAAMFNARLGRSAATAVPQLAPLPRPAPPPAATDLVRQALDSRPELAAGDAEVARATAEIEVMKSMYRPMAMIRLGRATTMAEGEGAMAMLGVSVPVWRGRLAAGVEEARAMQRMAQADLAAMRLMVEGDVTAARAGVVGAIARLDALRDQIVPRAQLAVESALAAYAAGRGTLVGVIEAATSLWNSRSELVMAETAVAQSRSRLARAVGRTETTPP